MIEKIIKEFDINGELIEVEKNNSGNINKTYVAVFKMPDGSQRKYLIQRINTAVFTEPYKLMKNIEGVTSHLKKKTLKENDTEHKVLEIIKTKKGKPLCTIVSDTGSKEYYRVYEFIENSVSYDCSTDRNIVYNTGRAFGAFQRLLADYPMPKLEETIKDFHNTEKRYQTLMEDIKIDSNNRVMDVAREIVFILKREDVCSLITSRLGKEIPLRVTHNDTKVNNVMMNKDTGDYLAVIDLDTVMPGSMLYDYGDGIRSTSSNAKEDEKDLSKVYINLDLFKAYTDGYLSEMAPYLTEEELSLMGESIRVITLELAIRFLNDYINGDTYFKVDYESHNLDRVRNQLKLVEDIEEKLDYINNYISTSYKKYQRVLKK
ncbi:MAG: phosphotransferase enzyme family protein [Bacilli bacterium]